MEFTEEQVLANRRAIGDDAFPIGEQTMQERRAALNEPVQPPVTRPVKKQETDAEVAERLRNSTTPVTMGMLMRFTEAQIKGTTDAIRQAFAAHEEQIDALKARVEELEAQPFHYDGPHETGKCYTKGMFVTHGGSLWHANYKTASKPGDGPAWTLAVKHGANGRDLR